MKIIPEGIISYANDCGDTICVRYGLVFVKYQLDDCHTDVMKHIRVNNAHNPIKINLEEASINGMATCLLAKHSYEYLKALFKNRLLFPRSPREGVSEFAPKHHLTSWCLCQYVEKFEFNPEKKSLLDWII
uniref:Transposase n=1 Tax=Rhabditophanes sp. KR3021 TaxID=114890 RepID=A0AC35TUI2_9BILA